MKTDFSNDGGFPESKGAISTVFTMPTEEQLDAFGKLRVSNPFTLTDHKFLYDENTSRYHSVLTGGGTAVYNGNHSCVDMNVGTVSGDKVIRQSALYYNYTSGKSHRIIMTLVPGADEANRRQRWGYFDEKNGVFFELIDGVLSVVVRTSTSGSVVTNVYGPETLVGKKKAFVRTLNLDMSKAQICAIDFQWLSVGRVRYALSVGGKLFYTAEVSHDNLIALPYMQTPNLPVRYEIENTGTCSVGATMKQICDTIESEGGSKAQGIDVVASNGFTSRTIPNSSYAPIIGIQLAPTFNSKEVRKKIEVTGIKVQTDENLHTELIHHRNYTSVTGGAFANVDAGLSALQQNVGLTDVVGGTTHTHHEDYPVVGGGPIKVGVSDEKTEVFSEHSWIVNNYDVTQSELFVLWGRSLGAGSAAVKAILDCFETD